MPGFANTALRLLKRMLGTASRTEGPYAGNPTVLDGNTAVVVTEAGISEVAGLGASFPAQAADLAWCAEQWRHGTNLAGSPLGTQTTEGPRGALAAAMGLAMAGVRATSFLSGPDLSDAGTLLTAAAGRRLPLVIHLSMRALAGHAPTLGSGHQAIHLAGDSGPFLFTAANVQEAVDFTLIARRVAEQALIPGLVAMDGEQTALSVQEVRLPPSGLIDDFLGWPGDQIPAPTPAQKLLLGEQRRRVPRWHNPDRPVMLSGLQAPEVWGSAKAAGRAFFDDDLAQCVDDAFEQFAEQTGRLHRRLSAYRVEAAKLILVAQGAAIETLEALADHLRSKHRMKVGVLGIRCLRPFPGAEIARLLGNGARVCVLERLDAPLATDPPLLREVRAAVDHALENDRFGADTYPGYSAVKEKQRPRFLSVAYGLGGFPLRGADLVTLCLGLERIKRPQVYLGINFAQTSSVYPKRQVLLDRLRRSYPGIVDLGLYNASASPDLRPDDALTLAVHRLSGGAGEGFMPDMAAFLHRLSGGELRGRPALFTDSWGEYGIDRLTFATAGLRDPGDETPVDLALLATDSGLQGLCPHRGLGRGAALLVQSALPHERLWIRLPGATRTALKEADVRLYRIPPPKDPASASDEYLLGAAFAVLMETGLLEITRRRLLGAREELLRQTVTEAAQHLAEFEAGVKQVQAIDISRLPLEPARVTRAADDEAPALVRQLGNIDDAYDSLPRFWDQVGVLYSQGNTAELAPDPYLAIGAVPPLSASFRDLSPLRKELPVFEPGLCTGCGACWSACPDAAINALVISPSRLLDAGIRKTGADALRPIASKLATGIAELCRSPDTAASTVEDLITRAYDKIKGKSPFPEDRKSAIESSLEQLLTDLGCLPVAVTAPMFVDPENRDRGSGELLMLAVDTEGCKGCGICIQCCEPGALQIARQSSHSLSQARRIQKAWHQLPDTELATIQRLGQQPEVGMAAAAALAPGAGLAVVGGDGAEPGSGAKLALRLTLAVVEARQAPRFEDFLRQVNTTREKITGLIRNILADALPADDLDALARGLQNIDSRQADMTTLIGEAEEQAIDNAIDAARLRRLVDLARDLGDLAWRLSTGRQGMGRARLSLVLSPDSMVGWASSFPHNPFSGPVTLDSTGDGAQLAAGLLEGQLRQATEGFVLMRKARVELERAADATRAWSNLEALTWRDLDDDERALCPSLLLVGDSSLLGGRGLGQVAWILGNDLPIKILLLADLDLGLSRQADLEAPLSKVDDVTIDLGLLALAQRRACIAQTSIGSTPHFSGSIQSAFDFPGPALLHVHAPSPARHGFAPDQTLRRAQAAVAARVFPLFRYHPQAEGVFGSRISLDDNPAPRDPWVMTPEGTPVSPALWALDERRFSDYFLPLKEGTAEPVTLTEYLKLSNKERSQRTPFVDLVDAGGEAQRLQVDERLVAVSAERYQVWRMLQELAGLVTPFTARVQREAEARVAAEREAELNTQAADYEMQIRDLRNAFQEETRQEMRERLMQLAGYQNAPMRKSE